MTPPDASRGPGAMSQKQILLHFVGIVAALALAIWLLGKL